MELPHIDLYYHKELENILNILEEAKILINLLSKLIHGKYSNKEIKI
jgi:hypothetical protein